VKVALSKTARKQLAKVPAHIVRKFALWMDLGQFEGLDAARAIPGFRDHALKGTWQGYRAVRLSDAYRSIYILRSDDSVETVYVEEVNKHDY
jgi:mRNA-degrading endonuclease YafQ of YafQ-DinJ toxin-antitoxin module